MDCSFYGKRPPGKPRWTWTALTALFLQCLSFGPGIRIGEATNPGPKLHIRSANVTSLRAAMPAVCGWEKHITCVQETRHSEPGCVILERDLLQHNWKPYWGHSMKLRSPGPWDTDYGGVAVLAPSQYPVHCIELQGETRSLWEMGRFTHACIPVNAGQDMLHLLNIYGYPNSGGAEAKEKNEALLAEVFAYATALGSVPVAVIGDFNSMETKSKILSWVDRGDTWTDISQSIEEVPSNTYCKEGPHQNMQGPGITRPDRAYCNLAMTATAKSMERVVRPGHALTRGNRNGVGT